MSFNNLPSSLQSVIQQGYLERIFRESLRARLGFRAVADVEPFTAGVGETITKTRPGLLAAITSPLANPANTDFTSGLTPQNFSVEQYVLGINQYAGQMMLNCVTSKVAIASIFLKNAEVLAEQAARSVDMLAMKALLSAYSGGDTFVTVTLGAPATTVLVDDVRGFYNTLNANGQVVPTSSSNPLLVTLGTSTYTLNSVVADGTAPATLPAAYANLVFSGTGSNTSTVPGGLSGVLTFSANVSTANGTIGNVAVGSLAPASIFAGTATDRRTLVSTNVLTMQNILVAKANMEANAVPTIDGTYHLFIDPIQASGLYLDPEFQSFTRGRLDSPEYKKGVIAEMLGVKLIISNLLPVQAATTASGYAMNGNIRQAILVGKGALIEGGFTAEGYSGVERIEDDMITMTDGIAHIVRAPLDALSQVVTSSWNYIGGFCVPTDTGTNPTTIPSATNAAYKRACVLTSV